MNIVSSVPASVWSTIIGHWPVILESDFILYITFKKSFIKDGDDYHDDE